MHLKESYSSYCYHQLRSVRSDMVTPDGYQDCYDARGELLCDEKYQHIYPDEVANIHLDEEIFDCLWNEGTEECPSPWPPTGLRANTSIPGLLHASRESRQTALKVYTMSFATLGSGAQTYINFVADTIYINTQSFACSYQHEDRIRGVLGAPCQDERTQLRNLAVDMEVLDEHTYLLQAEKLCEILALLGNVRSVTIVLGQYKNKLLEEGTTVLQRSSLAFQPFDIQQRVYMLQHPGYHEKHEDAVLPRILHHDCLNEDDILEFRSILEQESMSALTWPMPVLEYKVITSAAVKAKVDLMQRQYESTPKCRCYNEPMLPNLYFQRP